MSAKVIKTGVQISRDSRDVFNIEIRCEESNTLLARASMNASQFAMCITGLHTGDVDCEIGILSRVGKCRVRESRQVQPPFSSYCRDTCEKWLKENCQEDGWTIDAYLGSQSSMVHKNGVLTLNYSVYKFVEKEDV